MSASLLFTASAVATLLCNFLSPQRIQHHEEEDCASPPTLSPAYLSHKNFKEGSNKKTMPRNDSERSLESNYSLGLSKSESLADIMKLSKGSKSLGELCSSGKITIEVLKYLGQVVIVCGVCWKLYDLTSPHRRSK